MKLLTTILAVGATVPLAAQKPAQNSKPAQKPAQKRMNILFIAIDDLKPNIGACGNTYAHTPVMDKLAGEGALFTHCYVQQAVSGPTRASLMTGLRPDRTRVWDLQTNFRQVNPNVISMPQIFIQNGYNTQAFGKIYHETSCSPGHDADSWSIPYTYLSKPTYAIAKGRPVAECADVPDETYRDGAMVQYVIDAMDKLAADKSKPFFLAAGFQRPHLPFVAPKKYWDLFDRDSLPLEEFQSMSKNGPAIAYHNSPGLRRYSDIPKFDSYSPDPKDHMPADVQRYAIHGYLAATAYTDANIGKIIAHLEEKGLRDNTIIVIWGDHGWHLGDHGLWTKMTNFEQATRGLLIMDVPGKKEGIQPTGMCEFVDIFPTLFDLTGIKIPSWIDGKSMAGMLDDPGYQIKPYSMSQYPRDGGVMGYTIRTPRYRYTEWIKNFKTNQKYDPSLVVAREMYDYDKDPKETVNVVDEPDYSAAAKRMKAMFVECMDREYTADAAYDKRASWQKPIKMTGKDE